MGEQPVPTSTRIQHPLDPLTADEFRQVRNILQRDTEVGDGWRFASVELEEPEKAAALANRTGDEVPRIAVAVLWNRADGQAYRARVALSSGAPSSGDSSGGERSAGELASWAHLPDQHPNMTVDEWHESGELLRHEPRLVEALARRGHHDMDLVLVDMWAYGAALVPERYRGLRVGWGDVWVRNSPESNPYANFVSGLHPIMDLNRMELLEVEDDGAGPDTGPPVMGEYAPGLIPMPLREVAPLEIRQPAGVSFALDGHHLTWQNWDLRIGFNYREGLVLHTVGYRDGGRLRSVAHRLSFAEMVVPYRDPSVDHYRRTAFDIGEWGLGFMTTSLSLGCDCLGEIRYLDAVLHDSHGEPREIPQAICIHEEDNAVLWKHVDHVTGSEVRRMRRLVISFHVTVANYEYLVYWRLYQDGNIECEVRATGIMVTTRFRGEHPPAVGTVVDRQTYAPYHQHFIVARLDLDIDGTSNTVYASHSEASPVTPDNPDGLGLTVRNTRLRTESEGQQDYDWNSQVVWKVVNDSVRNGLGTPVGYKLVPTGCFPSMLDPSSPVVQRARAITHTLWVTPYRADERWPCGEFPNLSATDTGLPLWTAADRPIADVDVVLWYVFGLHHITRPEDWPVMPVDVTSFWLKPFGFFDRNPALDVPPDH
jgi:primary-amine oxidase